jgi:hypothetical protein
LAVPRSIARSWEKSPDIERKTMVSDFLQEKPCWMGTDHTRERLSCPENS